MPLLIDTYNVLHTVGVLPAEHAGIEVNDLIALMAVSRYRRHQCTLVCDGTGISQTHQTDDGVFRIIYSGPKRTADDVIIDTINSNTAPRQLKIVTSDAEILRAARRRRCPLLRSTTFLAHLAHDVEQPQRKPSRTRRVIDPLPRKEVKQWIHHFDLADHELELPAADEQQFDIDNDVDGDEVSPEIDTPRITPMRQPESIAGLPTDLIKQAQEMWGDQPAAKMPPQPKRSEPDKTTRDTNDTQHNQSSPPPTLSPTPPNETVTRPPRVVEDISEDELNSIDMTNLMPDVQPLNKHDKGEQQDKQNKHDEQK